MFRKTRFSFIITFVIALALMINYSEMAFAGFFDDSIDFDKGPQAAWWKCDISDYDKVKRCSITSDHDASSTCEDSSYHSVSESWKNKPEKIEVWGRAKYEGYGYVRFRSTGGELTRDSKLILQLTSRTVAGKKVGREPSLLDEGSRRKKKKPKYRLFRGDDSAGIVESLIYSLDPPIDIGNYTLTVNSGGQAFGDGLEASGGAYVELSTSIGVTLEVTGTYGKTVEWSKGNQNTETGILSKSWSWKVSEKAECETGHSAQKISTPHEHHWACPKDNGCGAHVQCKYSIPKKHELQASCWNAINGCPATNVRKCAHNCDYEPTTCSECNQRVETELEHYKACGSEVPGAAAGCGDLYWTCRSSDHNVLMCFKWDSLRRDFCGDIYRKCTNPGFPRGGCYYKRAHAHKVGVEVCDEGCFGSSCPGCSVNN